MQWFSLALITVVWPASIRGQATTIDFTAARQLVRDAITKDQAPGIAVAVARGDSILWEEGFGWANRETHVPATEHTPFYLASVTKTITATAAMILRERGRLDLDRPANDYLGASPIRSDQWDARGVTPRRLATHMSGLTTFDLGCAPAPTRCRLPTIDDVIRRYAVLVWPPGEQFDYSNVGYVALGQVVAHAAGHDLGTVLRDDVFRPLGMSESSLGVDDGIAERTAVQYSWTRGALPRHTSLLSGGSSAYGSAHDLVRFGLLHAKVHLPRSRATLSDASIDTMQYATVSAGGSSRYGLGWWVEEDRFGYRSVLAQGGTDASTAWLRIIPSEHIAVVVLANRGVGFASDVADAMIAAILPRYGERLATQRALAQAAPTPPPTITSPLVDSSIVGAWRGMVRAERGDVPIAVVVNDSGVAHARIGSESSERTGRARLAGVQMRLTIPGDLATPDSTGGRGLALYLRKRGGVYAGAATTRPPAETGLDGRVSYWVELRKQR